jgi:hypothetical protein
MYLPIRVVAMFALFLTLQEVHATAVDDIKLEVSSDICDGSNPADKSFVVYATNTNQTKRISANFSYDSKPSGQSFSLWDSNLTSFTDQFPKYHEKRLAKGERARVGCTINCRSSSNPKSYTAVPIVITTAGAVYVDPSKPARPPEKATDFVAFFPQVGFSACTGGPRPAGLFFIERQGRLSCERALSAEDARGAVGSVMANALPTCDHGLRVQFGEFASPCRLPVTNPPFIGVIHNSDAERGRCAEV